MELTWASAPEPEPERAGDVRSEETFRACTTSAAGFLTVFRKSMVDFDAEDPFWLPPAFVDRDD